MDKRVSAKLSPDTMSKLKRIGKYGDSVDDIVSFVCNHYLATTHRNSNGKFDGKGVRKR